MLSSIVFSEWSDGYFLLPIVFAMLRAASGNFLYYDLMSVYPPSEITLQLHLGPICARTASFSFP